MSVEPMEQVHKAVETDHRPSVAIVSNGPAPYRIALHSRIVRELPGVRLYTVFTHSVSNAPWQPALPDDIRPINFGEGERSADQAKPQRAWHEWKKAGRIIRWMRREDIRVIVVGGYNDLGRLRLIHWCRRHGVPCMMFADSNVLGDRNSGLKRHVKRWIVQWVVRNCAGLMPCGTLGRQYFIKYGADPNLIFYFPYEPDYGMMMTLSTGEIDSIRGEFGLLLGRKRVVFSGRLVKEKRADLLVDAFAKIADSRPDWDLLVIGDGPLRESLKSRLPTRLTGRVMWTGFLDDQRKIAGLYRLCDVLVLPSDFEPWALVINEAAASGLAIVSSDVVGAAAELVRPGVNGELFRAGDLESLVDKLRIVTDDANTIRLQQGSADVLADWRRRGDPVQGLTDALHHFEVLHKASVE